MQRGSYCIRVFRFFLSDIYLKLGAIDLWQVSRNFYILCEALKPA